MTNQTDSELMSDSRDQEEVEMQKMSLCGCGDGLTDFALINWTFVERAHTSTRSTSRPPGPAKPGDASQDTTEHKSRGQSVFGCSARRDGQLHGLHGRDRGRDERRGA